MESPTPIRAVLRRDITSSTDTHKALTSEIAWPPEENISMHSIEVDDDDAVEKPHSDNIAGTTWFKARILNPVRSMLKKPRKISLPTRLHPKERSPEFLDVYERSRFNLSSYFLPPARTDSKVPLKQMITGPYKTNMNKSTLDILESGAVPNSFEDWRPTGAVIPDSGWASRTSAETSAEMHYSVLPSTPPTTPKILGENHRSFNQAITADYRSFVAEIDRASSRASTPASIDAMMARALEALDEMKQGFRLSAKATPDSAYVRRNSSILAADYSSPVQGSVMSRYKPIRRRRWDGQTTPPPELETADTPTPAPLKTKKSVEPLGAVETTTPPDSDDESPTPSPSSKPLPSPPALQSASPGSRLANLEATKQDLVVQRANLEKGIHYLEESIKACPGIPQDTLQECRGLLADIKLEEHNTGLAIARARKLRDKQRNGDGEGLWVRRVSP